MDDMINITYFFIHDMEVTNRFFQVKAVKLKPGNSKHKGCGIDGELMNLNEPISITVLREQCQLIGHRANN